MIAITPTQAVIAGLTLACAVLFYTSQKNASEAQDLREQLASTTQLLDVSQSSLREMTTEVQKQNDAVDALKRAQIDSEARSALALAKAKKEAATARFTANQLLQKQKPAGVDACTAANNLFDEVLNAKN